MEGRHRLDPVSILNATPHFLNTPSGSDCVQYTRHTDELNCKEGMVRSTAARHMNFSGFETGPALDPNEWDAVRADTPAEGVADLICRNTTPGDQTGLELPELIQLDYGALAQTLAAAVAE